MTSLFTQTLSPAVEFVGDPEPFPGILPLLEKYGLACRAAAPSSADPGSMTLCFCAGEEDWLPSLLKRKNGSNIVVVTREELNQPLPKSITCFRANAEEDAFEIARCIYVKYYQLKAEKPTPSTFMMRQVFRYAMRILS